MATFELRDVTALSTGNARPAIDFKTKTPKVGDDGVPRVLVEVLRSEVQWGNESTSVVEVEIPAPGGEIPSLPSLGQVTIVRPVVDVYARKSGGLGARWVADAVTVRNGSGAAPEKVGAGSGQAGEKR